MAQKEHLGCVNSFYQLTIAISSYLLSMTDNKINSRKPDVPLLCATVGNGVAVINAKFFIFNLKTIHLFERAN